MVNHPNRSKKKGPSATPTPAQIVALRDKAGLTQTQAAAVVFTTLRNWQQWEGGERRMHPAFYELFRMKVNLARTGST